MLKGAVWYCAVIFYLYISQFNFKVKFGLMLHCICHRKLFKRQYKWLYTYINWVVCPFFGQTPETYFSHHIGMHHHENNMLEDSSSTIRYQRDSLKDFIIYFFDFLFLGIKNTFLYLYRHKRKKMSLHLLVGEFSFYLFCIFLCFVNFKATLFVFYYLFYMGGW